MFLVPSAISSVTDWSYRSTRNSAAAGLSTACLTKVHGWSTDVTACRGVEDGQACSSLPHACLPPIPGSSMHGGDERINYHDEAYIVYKQFM